MSYAKEHMTQFSTPDPRDAEIASHLRDNYRLRETVAGLRAALEKALNGWDDRDGEIKRLSDALAHRDQQLDALAAQRSDEAIAAQRDAAMVVLAALVRQLERVQGYSTHEAQAELREARALIAEGWRYPTTAEGMRKAVGPGGREGA